jgi:hypothetical protein
MGLSLTKIRNIHIFSTVASLVSLAAAIAGQLSNLSILLAGMLLLAHLPTFWFIRKSAQSEANPLAWIQTPAIAQIGFLLATSLLSTGLGFLSWIFLFEPGSQVRAVLIQLSPVIGWGVVVAVYLLAGLDGVLNREDEKRDGILIGAVLFSIIGHLFLFWLSFQIFSYTIDDAYITFRYSKNLASGFGPTYNPGLPPVEGYTTFLWMLLMTVPHFIGVNVATFSKIVGILLTCGTFALVAMITFQLTRGFPIKARLFFGVFGAYLLAMLPITSVHAIAGMETSLFIFLIALMVYLVTVGLLDGARSLYWAPLVGLLIGMTRPEGNAISLLLLVVAWSFSAPGARKKLTWYSLGLYILPGALYFLWRYLYYDLILPLPFYMKVLHGAGLFGGANEVGAYLLYLLPSIGLLFLVGLLRLRKEHLIILIPIVFLLLFYLFPVHAMGFQWRFIYPATPFIGILVAIGALTIFDLLRGAIRSRLPWEPLVLAGLLLIGFGNLQNLDGLIRDSQLYAAGISNYKTFGTLLSEYNHRHEYTVAIGDAGTVPYYSDWTVIDLFGLNSTEVAFGTVPVYNLVFEAQPADLILLSVGPNPNRISDEHAGAQAMYNQSIQRGMTLIGAFSFGRVNNIWVMGYPGTDLESYLRENMEFIGTSGED